MVKHDAGAVTSQGSTLRWRIIALLLIVSLLPLGLLVAGGGTIFSRMLEAKALELQNSVVERHAQAIDSYLAERLRLLQLLAESRTRTEVADPTTLSRLFDGLNRASDGGFVDLGVIGADGHHLAYVGPYDLVDRNYHDADWFGEVMESGVYISDVFLGFRQIPHCIIAARIFDRGERWILRATINSEQFDGLVRTSVLGKTGDSFLVNREGLYQTKPLVGAVMDRAPLPPLTTHVGVRDLQLEIEGRRKFAATTWVNGGRWALVAMQDAAEVRAPLVRAVTLGTLLALAAVTLSAVTTVLATRHLTSEIDKANRQREEMLDAFLRSAKLASVGELAVGLAHEINNPLAIMSAQQTNVADLLTDLDENTPGRDELLTAVARTKRQIERCGGITAKMLQFGRKHDQTREPTDLGPPLREIVALLDRQAADGNVKLTLLIEEDLPPVLVDRVEMEQVVVNLVKNALDALPDGGHVGVSARRQQDTIDIEVRDDGEGVSRQQLRRIFEPFYTTKPVGKGTGLGLSVCYGLVQSWGGHIEAESEPGEGMVMRIKLPVPREAPVGVRGQEET